MKLGFDVSFILLLLHNQCRFCHTPLVCEGEGPVECKTVYESECQTRYHEHDVEDDVVECETINVSPALKFTLFYNKLINIVSLINF